jgi:hypothetical protein
MATTLESIIQGTDFQAQDLQVLCASELIMQMDDAKNNGMEPRVVAHIPSGFGKSSVYMLIANYEHTTHERSICIITCAKHLQD